MGGRDLRMRVGVVTLFALFFCLDGLLGCVHGVAFGFGSGLRVAAALRDITPFPPFRL